MDRAAEETATLPLFPSDSDSETDSETETDSDTKTAGSVHVYKIGFTFNKGVYNGFV